MEDLTNNRTSYAEPIRLQNVSVNHCGRKFLVSKQILNRANVAAVLQNMYDERMYVMKENILPNPINICFLGLKAVMAHAHQLLYVIKQF